MSDIVERLRHCSENCGDEYLHELTGKAADTITRLTSENEKLGRDYQSARDAHDKVLAENERLRLALDEAQQAFALERYNAERLRAALKQIAGTDPWRWRAHKAPR